MTASTEPTADAPVFTTPRYEPFVDQHIIWQAECPCNWRGEIRATEAQANAERDNHRVQHVNEILWPEGMEVRWVKRSGRNGDTVEWWKGTVVRHAGIHVVIKVEGYRDYQAVNNEDLRRP